jgi:hypothetical protein
LIIADNDQEVLHTDGDTAIAYAFRYELVQIVGHRIGSLKVVTIFITV